MDQQQDDVHQGWKSEWPVLGRSGQTWLGCLLIGLALFCAVQAYLAVERQRGLIPEVVSIFVEDGTAGLILRVQTPQHNAAVLRQLRRWYAPPQYWRAVEFVGYLAWLMAGLAAWQGLCFSRRRMASHVGGSDQKHPPSARRAILASPTAVVGLHAVLTSLSGVSYSPRGRARGRHRRTRCPRPG